MSRFARLGVVGAAAAGLALAAALPSASAATMTHTFMLHGLKYAPHAMGSARVTQVSAGDYRVQVTAEGLPAPEMLHAMPRRHVYLAWAIDGMKGMHEMMGVIALKWNPATHVYAASKVVMMQHVTEIFITADKSPMQHMPTMPEVGVMSSGHSM